MHALDADGLSIVSTPGDLSTVLSEVIKRDCLTALNYQTAQGVLAYYRRYAAGLDSPVAPVRVLALMLRSVKWARRYAVALESDLQEANLSPRG